MNTRALLTWRALHIHEEIEVNSIFFMLLSSVSKTLGTKGYARLGSVISTHPSKKCWQNCVDVHCVWSTLCAEYCCVWMNVCDVQEKVTEKFFFPSDHGDDSTDHYIF